MPEMAIGACRPFYAVDFLTEDILERFHTAWLPCGRLSWQDLRIENFQFRGFIR